MSEDLAVTESAPEPETVTPPDTVVEDSEAESVAAEPEPVPDPAEQRRAHVLNAVARKEARIQKERAEVASERSEVQRIMSEAQALRESVSAREKAIANIFDGDDDPIEALIALGHDPEKAIYRLNDRILSRGTPEAKMSANDKRIADLEAKLAEREAAALKMEQERASQAAVARANTEFGSFIETEKTKYPAVAKMNVEVRSERMWALANAYNAKTGQTPTYDMLADALEYTVRSQYDELRSLIGESESVRAGDGLQELKPKAPKLSSVLATQHATPPPKRELTEEEWRENFVRDWEKSRANAQR